MIDWLRKLKIASALNRTKAKHIKNKNARLQADEAKAVLHTHKQRKPKHHEKVAVKKN
jgi:hypothetical protein